MGSFYPLIIVAKDTFLVAFKIFTINSFVTMKVVAIEKFTARNLKFIQSLDQIKSVQ